ncbi:MAG: helix-turn-helix domain-containing protein [Candidatus Limnocylindrales bacterium]
MSDDRLALAVAELVDAIVAAVQAEAATTADTPDRLLSVDEAAAALGVARSTTYHEIQAGRLHSLKIGKRRMISTTTLRDYIEAAGSAARPAVTRSPVPSPEVAAPRASAGSGAR